MTFSSAPVLTLMASVGAASPPMVERWNEFKQRYAKNYNGEEEDTRFMAFVGRVEHIESENAKNHSYTLGINTFADLTAGEEAALTKGRPQSLDAVSPAFLGWQAWTGEASPAAVDWTTKGAVTAVKDQGICGSCWAFSGVAALEGAGAVASGRLVSMSEQQAMQCACYQPNRGCSGGYENDVFTYAQKNDMCTEAFYPYQGVETIPCFWNKPRCTGADVGLPKELVMGFKKVTADSEEALMAAVAQQPISIAVDTENWLTYASGIMTGGCAGGRDHAVTLVGYTGDYWKVKNSWGASWGIQGYILLARGAGGHGQCGILAQPSFPVVVSATVI